MRLPGRGGREREGRVVAIQDSTLARAGEAATRLALEETLLRRGWRVIFFDEHFGPLFGPERPKLFDGIAIRLLPGAEEKVELRLVCVESDTLEAPPELIERVRRAARSASVEWLVAAFDGESMRVVPVLDEIESAIPRPSPPPEIAPPSRGAPVRAASGRRQPLAVEPPHPRAAALPSNAGGERVRGATPALEPSPVGARRGRRRGGRSGKKPPTNAGRDAAAVRAGRGPSTPRAEESPSVARAETPRGSGATPLGQASEARQPVAAEAAPAEGANGSGAAGSKRGRRRGKRGGRRRSGR
jgi:hypothetical protein